MESEEGQLNVLQKLELMIQEHVQDRTPYALSELEEKAKVCTYFVKQKCFR